MNAARTRGIAFVASMLVGIGATACKTQIAPGPSAIAPHRAKVFSGADLATAGPGLSLHDALVRLLPESLRWDANDGLPVVYIDGLRASDFGVLHRVECGRARKVVVMNGFNATLAFGSGHTAGAILVTSAPRIIHRSASPTRCRG